MKKLIALATILLLIGCESPTYNPEPWDVGVSIPPPKACAEARIRDSKVNC